VLLAHLSDLHLRDADDVIKLQRQLDRIVLREPVHLAITGDLLDRWRPSLLDRALHALEVRGFLESGKVTILHGNHDLASSGGHPRRRSDLWRLVLRFWDPPPVVAWRRRRFYARLASHDPGIAGEAPILKHLDAGLRIAVIDTVPVPWKPVAFARGSIALQHAIGSVDAAQAEWLAQQRGADPLVLLIHHYPLDVPVLQWQSPRWRIDVPMAIAADDRTALWSAAEKAGAVLVLCGHVHRTRLEHRGSIAVGLNGQSGADWAGRTIAYYRVEGGTVTMETERGT